MPAVAHSQLVGTPVQSKIKEFTVALKPRYPAELQAFVNDVSNPRSDNYRHWLTPAQIGQQFGANPTAVTMIINYFRSKGLTLTLQPANRMALMFRGTVTQIQNAFQTKFKDYRGPDPMGNTISFEANSTPLNLPANIINVVQAVSGLEDWTRPVRMAQTQTLTPALVRGLYNTKPAFDLGFRGQGMTIGVSNWDGFSLSNVPLFVNAFSLPIPPGGAGSNVSVVTIQGGSQNNGANGEGDLDIQMELSQAPLANIIVYDGGGDELSVLTKEASDNAADLISESWGWRFSSSVADAAHTQHLIMSAQGQTYMCATGDSGTNITTFVYPDCDPEVLGVGGTVATVDGNTGTRISEVAWAGGGGGWTTSGYSFDKRPSWQTGNGVPTTPNARYMPDIALHAAGNGGAYFFFSGGSEGTADGTSFASPVNASCLAIVEQRLIASGQVGRLGRVQDAIYAQNGRSDVWHDITQGSNGTLPDGTTSNAGPGWDFCCGWGAPDYDALYNALIQQVTMTPYFPTSISTALGTYLIGDTSSVTDSDGIYYQIGSQAMTIGQGAGVFVSFTVPDTTIAMSFDLQTNAGVPGGTNMVWLYNWFTDNYDLVGACPMNSAGSVDQVIKVRTNSVPNYIGPGGQVDAVVRGHLPIKPFNNQMPDPFTYKLDQLEVLVR
ncbi:MAG TPA: protease pro-enzyme activation domain-containing protein [Fimbriimonadaceae bacterium]|nr:protease pro-enzyme activation domain-containing protein [Fimbriimonadaceae bacterium]